jgi:SAM-dependent methyltransferase
MSDPATVYEEWFVPALFAPLAREVLDHTEIPVGARVLDVACGTGIVARTIARRMGPTGQVVGLDLSPAMLAAARGAAEVEELAIEVRQGNAEHLPFADGTFDLVLCQMGMQFIPDRPRAAAEMHRVLTLGGQVVISTWRGLDQNPFFAEYEQAVRRRFDSPALETPFVLGDPLALAALLQDAGFTDVSIEPVMIEANYTEPDRFIELQVKASAAAIPELQRLAPAELDALIAAIREDMAEPVREATFGDRLRFPMQGIVARGVKR